MRSSHFVLGFALALTTTQAGAGIKVYVDKDYNGASIEIDSAVPDLRKLDFDDRISSLQADERWLVCSAPKFKGDCREVEGALVNLRAEGLNDRITSLKPAKKNKRKDADSEKKEKAAMESGPAVVPAVNRPREWWGGAS